MALCIIFQIKQLVLATTQRVNANQVKFHAERYDEADRDADRNALKNTNKNHVVQYDDDTATKKALKSVANKQAKIIFSRDIQERILYHVALTRLLVK